MRTHAPVANPRSDATATNQSARGLPVLGSRSLAPLEDSNAPPAMKAGSTAIAHQAPTVVIVSLFIGRPPWEPAPRGWSRRSNSPPAGDGGTRAGRRRSGGGAAGRRAGRQATRRALSRHAGSTSASRKTAASHDVQQ